MEQIEVFETGSLEGVVLTNKEKRQHYKELAISRVGETRLNKMGSLMTVEKYNGSQEVWVRFIDSGYMAKCSWQHFVSGSVKNPYDKSVFGVGYIGVGDYEPYVDGKTTIQYRTWSAMLQRCCTEKFKEEHPTYKDCRVAEEWLCFQNFAKWFDDNYYEVEGQRMDLDKDILVKGNKIYSPETCVFVPQVINSLFVKRNASRGNLPVGVRIDRSSKKNPYMARAGNGKGEQVFLGNYNTPEKAFESYKEYKEQTIKNIAEEYKGWIPNKLYNAMLQYTVDIND